MVSSLHCLQPMEMRQIYCENQPGVGSRRHTRGLSGGLSLFNLHLGSLNSKHSVRVPLRVCICHCWSPGHALDRERVQTTKNNALFFWGGETCITKMPSKDMRQKVFMYTNEQLSSMGCKTTYNPYRCLGYTIP